MKERRYRWKERNPEKNRQKQRERKSKQYHGSRQRQLYLRIRVSLCQYAGGNTSGNKGFMRAITGLTIEQFREKFKRVDGMTFDHVVPCSAFDLTKPEHVVRACYWENIKLLPKSENERKSDSVPVGLDIMSLPWVGTNEALLAAWRFITKPKDRWMSVDWSRPDEEIASKIGCQPSTVRQKRLKETKGGDV